jgi:diacylglycerol kinase family enzyme
MLPRLYDGTHTQHALSETRRVKQVQFALDAPVDVMIDGEIATLTVLSLDVLPGAMDVYV